MEEYLIQSDTLTGIANAIREKTGKTENINVLDMASEIASISVSSGSDTGSGTSGNMVTGTISVSASRPSIDVQCTFTPSKLVMYAKKVPGDNEIWVFVYQSDGIDVQGRDTYIFYVDPNAAGELNISRDPIYMSNNGDSLTIEAPSIDDSTDLTFTSGTWYYIAIE